MSRNFESRKLVISDLQDKLADCRFGHSVAELLIVIGVFFGIVGLEFLGVILGCIGLSAWIIYSVNEVNYEKKLFIEQYSVIDEVLENKIDELNKENSLEGLKKIRGDVDDICENVERFEKIVEHSKVRVAPLTSLRRKIRGLDREVDEKINDLKSFDLLKKAREDNGLDREVDEKINDLKSFNLKKTCEDNGLNREKVENQPEISNDKGKSAEMGISA